MQKVEFDADDHAWKIDRLIVVRRCERHTDGLWRRQHGRQWAGFHSGASYWRVDSDTVAFADSDSDPYPGPFAHSVTDAYSVTDAHSLANADADSHPEANACTLQHDESVCAGGAAAWLCDHPAGSAADPLEK